MPFGDGPQKPKNYELLVLGKDGLVTERKFYEEAGGSDVLMAHHKSTFDEMHRLWKEKDALIGGSTTWYARTYELDQRGLTTTVTDRRSNDTTFTYDGAGRRLSATDPLGNETTWEPDENGNVTAVEESEIVPGGSPEVFRTEFEFDALNRMKKRTEIDRTNGSNTKVTEWKRDSLGVVRKVIDPKGNVTMRVHDDFGRVTQERVDMGSSAEIVTTWAYSPLDKITQLVDDNGSITAYGYDSLGRLSQKTYEDTKTVSYEYDLNGNVTEITDQNGSEIAQGFDDLDRLYVRAVTPASAAVIGDTDHDFEYDAMNRLTLAADNDSRVELTYDSLSRVLTETQGNNPLSGSGKTVTYAWDEESNRTLVDYPSGFEAHESRDAIGRIDEIEDGSSNSIAAFDLYGAGLRRKQTTFQNGTTSTIGYDGFRRPVSIVHEDSTPTEFAGFEYGWDANDNLTYEARRRTRSCFSSVRAGRRRVTVRRTPSPRPRPRDAGRLQRTTPMSGRERRPSCAA